MLTKKVGPLPVWAWVAVVVVGYIAYKRYAAAKAASASAAATTANQQLLTNAYANVTGEPWQSWSGYSGGATAPGQGAAGTSPGSGAGTPGTTPTPSATGSTPEAGQPCQCPGSSTAAPYGSTTDANGNCQCGPAGQATLPTTGGGTISIPVGPGPTPTTPVGGLSSTGQYVTAQTGVSYTQVPAGTPGAVQFSGQPTWYLPG